MNQLVTTPEVLADADCPRCKKPLIDPAGLGWCKACGYCKSLVDNETKPTVQQQPQTQAQPATAAVLTPQRSYAWMIITPIGMAMVIGGLIATGKYYNFKPLDRAIVTSVVSGVGLALMLIGQFIGLLRVAPDDPSLTFKDAIFPFRLYGLIFKRLPLASITIYLGTWGLAAIITVNITVGGTLHWLEYLPKSKQKK